MGSVKGLVFIAAEEKDAVKGRTFYMSEEPFRAA
jgi:hypothetical protein